MLARQHIGPLRQAPVGAWRSPRSPLYLPRPRFSRLRPRTAADGDNEPNNTQHAEPLGAFPPIRSESDLLAAATAHAKAEATAATETTEGAAAPMVASTSDATASPSPGTPQQDPAVEAAEAALRKFTRSAAEIFRLAVVLPFRYLVIIPAVWALTKMGFLPGNHAEALMRLEFAHQEKQLTADDVAEALRALSRHHPQEVADFVEQRCLVPKDAPGPANYSPVPVNASVVREYLVALVRSGRIKEYDGGVMAGFTVPPSDGRTHRSLPRLLEELQAAAKGQPLPSAAGQSVAWPLHVVVQDAGALRFGAAKKGPGLLENVAWFVVATTLFMAAWGLGTATVRRYSSGGSEGIPSSSGAGIGVASSGSGGMFGQHKEYKKENVPEKSAKTFADVKGCDEAVTELQEIVAYLKSPEKFTRMGGKLPKGVLLTGPPGTGKTLLARAVAGEAGVPFFYKAGSEFEEMFVGVGARRVRDLFATAKKKAPCIVFIDEVDAVGGKRTNWESSGGSRKTLNQLLTDMDGFEENSGVVVMAATNLPELLDSALTRPGRFDRQVTVSLPDVRGRQQILDLYLTGKPLAADVDAQSLARRTPGLSGAQLANLVNEAALLAARVDADAISALLLDEARDKVLMGSPRSLQQSMEARRLTAYHESGHALVALYTKGATPIHKATIVPRGHALGMVSQVPDKDEYSVTKQQMTAQIDVSMGGKAAEELVFGPDHVTSGATSDLKAATWYARHMVEDCGMSELIGPMALEVNSRSGGAAGPDARRSADQEVSKILKESYSRVAGLLKAKESELHELAAALLERETLTQRDIKELLWGGVDGLAVAVEGAAAAVEAEGATAALGSAAADPAAAEKAAAPAASVVASK